MSNPLDRSLTWEEGRSSSRFRASSSPAIHSETAAERLTDDLIVEILLRVPAKSLFRFKCVSKHWLGLTNDRHNLKKLPQTLTGFFHRITIGEQFQQPALHFTNLSGCRNLSYLEFLPKRGQIVLLDCCNGLVLCRWQDASVDADEFRYVVCNPTTEEWAELPDSGHASSVVGTVRLGFDPTVSPHFHVFMLVTDQDGFFLAGVNFYSSETGRWVYKEEGWKNNITLGCDRRSATVYLNGRLHFIAYLYIRNACFVRYLAVVDTKGESWTNIPVPTNGPDGGFLQQSQGRLHCAGYGSDDADNVVRLLLYVLEDYDSNKWILSHSVETSSIFGGTHVGLCWDFYWIAFHPECSMIFFVTGNMTFMCYDMDRRQVKVICDLKDGVPPYLPFVPLYAELQSLHK